MLQVNKQFYFRIVMFGVKTMFGSAFSPTVVGLPNNSYNPITNTAWVRARLCKLQNRCTRLAAASDKVYQLLIVDLRRSSSSNFPPLMNQFRLFIIYGSQLFFHTINITSTF
jgi:hypothetical protein